MRITVLLLALTSVTGAAGLAGAQGRVYPEAKAFLTLGDAAGTAVGGPLGGTTLLQAMRASGVVTIRGTHALDVTAVRLQTFLPPGGSANDYEYGNPEGDALILSLGELGQTRARGIPDELAIGGGVIRRHTAEVGRTRDTWIARAGFDAAPFTRWSHADSGVSFHMFFMPTNTSSMMYVATLGLYFRIG